MNSSRYSELGAVLAVVALLAVAAVPVTAVSVSGDSPASVEVDSSQELTYEVEDLYTDYDQWTLRASTELTEVSWTVTLYDQTGAQIDRLTYNGQTFEQSIDASNDVNRVEVRLEGRVPAVESYSYEPPQSMTVASFAQVQEGGTSTTLEAYDDVRPYTSESQEARTAIDAASDAIDSAQAGGASVSGAEGDLEDAIEFYDSGNFEQAISNAEEAESTANSAASSAQQTQLLLYGGVAVVVLLLIGGGAYWYLQQRDTYDKLG
jgi:hypothetical protein